MLDKDRYSGRKRMLNVLLVEDHFPDVVLTKKAFERGGFPYIITVARDGEEAIDLLFGNSHKNIVANSPDVILLDINLPKISGYEVLERVKKNVDMMDIPVIMLTSSSAEQDMERSYELNANSYLVKPSSLSKYVDIVNFVEGFWSKIANLNN